MHSSYSKRSIGELLLYADELTGVDTAGSNDTWCIVIGKAWPLSTGNVDPRTPSLAAALLELAEARGDAGVEQALYDVAAATPSF